MTVASFTVPGRPVPKQRPRLGRNGNIYTPKNCREYEKAVGWAARQLFKNPLEGPVELHVRLYLNSKGGDLDNYIKAICDGLNGVAWLDDSQVERLMASMAINEVAAERADVLVRLVEIEEGEMQFEKSGL
jgi:Holliday junction resolvase RusA-like endonuclease